MFFDAGFAHISALYSKYQPKLTFFDYQYTFIYCIIYRESEGFFQISIVGEVSVKKIVFVVLIALVLIVLVKVVPNVFIEATLGSDEPLLPDASIEEDSKEKEVNSFSLPYTEVGGVLTFRGDNFRTAPAYGVVDMKDFKIKKIWNLKAEAKGIWGGGSGWTGQPALVKWPQDMKKIMNIKDKFKEDEEFVEVIIASLNGKVYFIDLKTGEETRNPIDTGSPIKGSVSVDSRGYPLLYVGQGIKEKDEFGFRLYSLVDQKQLFLLDGEDEEAPRLWPNFDSSALFSRHEDTLYVGGENGLFYKLKLNTLFEPEEKIMEVNPEVMRFKYERPDDGNKAINSNYGIENSPAAWENLIFFADNGGLIKAIDTELNEIWTVENIDDTDATVTIDIEDGEPMIYTGCQVDKQGDEGLAKILKIKGKTGEILWEKSYKAFNKDGPSPSNGGLLGTNVVGKKEINNLVIFTLCRTPNKNDGLMVALDKATGEEVWSWVMPTYAWPSPVDVYDKDGKAYIIQTLRNGTVCIIEGATGEILGKTVIDSYIEASPAVFNNYMVIASRNGYIYGLELK